MAAPPGPFGTLAETSAASGGLRLLGPRGERGAARGAAGAAVPGAQAADCSDRIGPGRARGAAAASFFCLLLWVGRTNGVGRPLFWFPSSILLGFD